MRDFPSGRNQDFRFDGCCAEFHKVFRTCFRFQAVYIYVYFLAVLRFDVQRNFVGTDHLIVFLHGIGNHVLLQIGEVETVGYPEFSGCRIDGFEAYILMCILHLAHGRMRSTVRADDTVATEVSVARHVGTEVAAVCPVFASVFIFYPNTLVYPVPDVSALQVRIFVDSLPLIPETSCRVTHSVSIFRRSYRAVTSDTSDFFQPGCIRILRNIHV